MMAAGGHHPGRRVGSYLSRGRGQAGGRPPCSSPSSRPAASAPARGSAMTTPSHPRLVARLRRAARAAAVLVGGLLLAGRGLDVGALRGVFPLSLFLVANVGVFTAL